jgi:hypothetical protein
MSGYPIRLGSYVRKEVVRPAPFFLIGLAITVPCFLRHVTLGALSLLVSSGVAWFRLCRRSSSLSTAAHLHNLSHDTDTSAGWQAVDGDYGRMTDSSPGFPIRTFGNDGLRGCPVFSYLLSPGAVSSLVFSLVPWFGLCRGPGFPYTVSLPSPPSVPSTSQ